MSNEDAPHVEEHARRLHDSAVLMVRKVLGDPRTVVFAASLDDAGLPRRFVLLNASDDSIVLDVAADPEAEAGPASYAAVLEALDLTVTQHDLLRTTRKGPFRLTSADVVAWEPRSAKLAVRRLLHRDGGLLTGAESRRYPWIKADWRSAGLFYTMWYGDPAPAPTPRRGAKLGAIPLTALLGKHFTATSQPLPGETGDAEADARRILAVLREIAAGTAPVSPHFPTT